MLRTIYAAAAFAIIGAPASFAGPYINAETNANWADKKYTNATTDVHVGYAGTNDTGKLSYYVQGGPAFVAVKDADTETRISGKAGASVALSEATDVYGEVSFLTGEEKEDFATGGKLGIKYNF
ncbi:hypothetical protein CMK18_22125 [Candidatus Poribacteria bacterium]|nr:hypothetical protein [Candidatus Poribacteria bacterium]